MSYNYIDIRTSNSNILCAKHCDDSAIATICFELCSKNTYEKLELSHNRFTDVGVSRLMKCLVANTSITRINCRMDSSMDSTNLVKALFEEPANFSELMLLFGPDDDSIKFKHALDIVYTGIANNTTLRVLFLFGLKLAKRDLNMLRNVMAYNVTLRDIYFYPDQLLSQHWTVNDAMLLRKRTNMQKWKPIKHLF
jgi:hypothetical protein